MPYFDKFEKQHYHSTRFEQFNTSTHRLSMTERGCEYAVLKCYNKLPLKIRRIQNVKQFRAHLRNFLVIKELYLLDEYFEGNGTCLFVVCNLDYDIMTI